MEGGNDGELRTAATGLAADITNSLNDLRLVAAHEKECKEEAKLCHFSSPLLRLIEGLLGLLHMGFRGDEGSDVYALVLAELLDKQSLQDVQLHNSLLNQPELTWILNALNQKAVSSFLYGLVGSQSFLAQHYSSTALMQQPECILALAEAFEVLEGQVAFSLRPSALFLQLRAEAALLSEQKGSGSVSDASKSVGTEMEMEPVPITQSTDSLTLDDYDELIESLKLASSNTAWTRLKERAVHLITALLKKPRERGSLCDSFVVVEDGSEFASVDLSFDSLSEKPRAESLLKLGICPDRGGLAGQNYCCSDCGNGLAAESALQCDFTGEYMCRSCHGGGWSRNPVRILKSWDFASYSMSTKGQRIATELSYAELFDLDAVLVKDGLRKIPHITLIKKMRRRVHQLAQTTLRGDAWESKLKMAWPKGHLLGSVQLYCVEDLVEMWSGRFVPEILVPLLRSLEQ